MKLYTHYTVVIIIAEYAFIIIVFRPGDEGLFWYTVLSGSLEMLQEDNNNSSKVSIGRDEMDNG